MNPLVTVVIPSYNHEKYVAAAVDSCLSQTHTKLEVIVVDDGSQDSSVDCLRERYAGDQRVRISTQQHAGAHAALNEGIRQASGEYIAILNSDDLFDHRRIEVLLHEAQQVDSTGALVFSDLEFIDGEGHPAPEHERAHGYRALQQRCRKQAIESVFLVGNVAMTSSNLFFSKALFDAVGEFAALRYTHDWEWALRATMQCRPIWVQENLLSYRVHGSNTISEGDIWCHIRENAFVHAKAIWTLKERLASMDDPSTAGRDAYSALFHNKSFLPLPTLYFLVQRLAGLTEAQLLELVTAGDDRRNLQYLASELGLPADLFLSVQHILEREHTVAAQARLIEERWAAMQRMEAIIRERDETIAAQARLVEERWAAMQRMEAIIRERDETIAAQARLMKGWRRLALRPSDLQSDIAAQARLIEERWAAMQRMEAIIRERDETIAAQARMVEERWAAMQRMGQEIANRDQSIAGLQQELQNAKQKLFLPHAGSPHEGP